MATPHSRTTDETGGQRTASEGAGTAGRARRVAAGVLGAGLLVRGVRRRSLRGLATALVGGWLLVRVAGGRRVGGALRSRLSPGDPDADGSDDAPTLSRSVTVGRPADELFELWRDPDRLSAIVGHVASVAEAGEDRLRWTVDGPRGRELSWETRVVEAEPGDRLRWETPPGAMVPFRGTVSFRPAPGDRGTEVTLSVDLDPPGGAVTDAALRRLGVVPEALLGTALDRFAALAETGEIPTLADNPSARGRGDRL